MSSSAPLALSRRRSQLRWRLSYLALSLLVFWVAKAAILVVLALRVDGAPGVVLSELADLLLPYRTSVRHGFYWLTAATAGVMALTAVQIYVVGGRPKGATQRSVARNAKAGCAGTPSRGGRRPDSSFWLVSTIPRADTRAADGEMRKHLEHTHLYGILS
ncbi:hypothetical protein WJ97_14480 [Burkholderia ubonensis]|uniref:hypothetical protein n=1 Tax=Burkholderia ubonensis TaxID=101571 RepID=UPI00075DD6B9|nr:hypothetical protein [Burkholderia ubonensis]KVP97022.1 hypothetical protein WJ97_14480 [Burkholderia ubonensis]